MDPAMFFEDVFTERTARLREQAEHLREELARVEASDPIDTRARAEHDHG